jgi:hypothetical protein
MENDGRFALFGKQANKPCGASHPQSPCGAKGKLVWFLTPLLPLFQTKIKAGIISLQILPE